MEDRALQSPGDEGKLPADVLVRVNGLHRLSLKGLNLTVRRGERVAVIGETGSGKSVLLRCILGLEKPESGQVELLGRQVKGHIGATAGLGVALQQPGLLDSWSVTANIEKACVGPLSEHEMRRLLDSVGLDEIEDPVSTDPRGLSGGQQKRVALLRALQRGSTLLLLDEPASGLDPTTVEAVTKVLRAAIERDGRSLLLISHDYREVVDLCDRILVLAGGTLREFPGKPANPESLVSFVATLPGATPPATARRKPHRLTATGAFLELLWRGAPLCLVAMTLLGVVLVAQTAGIGPIDTSRWVPMIVMASVSRELAPLLVGLLLSSRASSQIAAEVGGMSYTGQLLTLRLIGESPTRILLFPYALASAAVFPILVILGALAAIVAGALVAGLPWIGLTIGTRRFLDLAAESLDVLLPLSCLVKGLFMGLSVAVVSYLRAARTISSAEELGRVVTSATVLSAAAVVAVDLSLSLVLFARRH